MRDEATTTTTLLATPVVVFTPAAGPERPGPVDGAPEALLSIQDRVRLRALEATARA